MTTQDLQATLDARVKEIKARSELTPVAAVIDEWPRSPYPSKRKRHGVPRR